MADEADAPAAPVQEVVAVEAPAAPRVEPIEIDTGAHFQTDKTYADRDELIEWVRSVAHKLKFSVAIVKSDYGSDRRKQFFVLECERGGTYKPTNKKTKLEGLGTRKCGCPFRLRGYYRATKEWSLSVVRGQHNHVLDKALVGHLLAGRLKRAEKEFVDELTRNLVAPRNIINTLKERDPQNATEIKQVYNVRHRSKVSIRGSMTEMQHLIKCLEGKNYVYQYRTVGETSCIQDIFFAHPKSVKLFNSFPSVLVMDCTYKTNRYKMPLFQIVGVTSTMKTFTVCFALLSNEKKDNFTWALEACRGLLWSKDMSPSVVVTDRCTALMNSNAVVFPKAQPMVCTVHVRKNVKSKAKTLIKVRETKEVKATDVVKRVMKAFDAVVFSSTEDEYLEAVEEFNNMCAKWPKFLQYVHKTVLNTDKEKLVYAWTDRIMHLGNTTSNRVESAHGKLKANITNSKIDFVKLWQCVEKTLISQLTEIQASFGKSLSVVEHRHAGSVLYEQLVCKISRKALKFIYKEAEDVEEGGMESERCGCVLRSTFGLPCACFIAKKIHGNLPITLDDVDDLWKKLVFEDGEVGEVEDDWLCVEEWKAIQARLRAADPSMRAQIKKGLRQFAWPESTQVSVPEVKSSKRGKSSGARSTVAKKKKKANSTTRDPSYWEHVDKLFPDTQPSQSKPIPESQASVSKPKRRRRGSTQSMPDKFPHIRSIPLFMHEWIDEIIDVKGDGYCGYRSIAVDRGRSEDQFTLVEMDMLRELNQHRDAYITLYGGRERYDEMLEALKPPLKIPKYGACDEKFWFTFPDMGHIVASYYQKPVVMLCEQDYGTCEIFFPLRGKPPSDTSSHVTCLLFVNGIHFLNVKLKPDCPIPQTCVQWSRCRTEEAAEWEDRYVDRQAEWVRLMNIERPNMVAFGTGFQPDDPITIS